jgi:hypothetical protein
MNVSNSEVASLARIVGKDDVRKFSIEDLIALNKDLSEVTGVKWLNGRNINL